MGLVAIAAKDRQAPVEQMRGSYPIHEVACALLGSNFAVKTLNHLHVTRVVTPLPERFLHLIATAEAVLTLALTSLLVLPPPLLFFFDELVCLLSLPYKLFF